MTKGDKVAINTRKIKVAKLLASFICSIKFLNFIRYLYKVRKYFSHDFL